MARVSDASAASSPFLRFQSLAKRLVSVPKAEVDAKKATEEKKPRKGGAQAAG